MNSINIDVGGTFTDLVLNFDGKALIKKTPTTPYDLSVCFSRVIEDGAAALGLKINELLPAIDMIRYSTTIAIRGKFIRRWCPGRSVFRPTRSGCASWNFIVRVAGLKSRPSICLRAIPSRMISRSIWIA